MPGTFDLIKNYLRHHESPHRSATRDDPYSLKVRTKRKKKRRAARAARKRNRSNRRC